VQNRSGAVADRHRFRSVIKNQARQLAVGDDLLIALLLGKVGEHHADGFGAELDATSCRNEDGHLLAAASAQSQLATRAGVVSRFAKHSPEYFSVCRGNDVKNGGPNQDLKRLGHQIGERLVGVEDYAAGIYGNRTFIHRFHEDAIDIFCAGKSEHLLLSSARDYNRVDAAAANGGQRVFTLLQSRAKLAYFLREPSHLGAFRIILSFSCQCHKS